MRIEKDLFRPARREVKELPSIMGAGRTQDDRYVTGIYRATSPVWSRSEDPREISSRR